MRTNHLQHLGKHLKFTTDQHAANILNRTNRLLQEEARTSTSPSAEATKEQGAEAAPSGEVGGGGSVGRGGGGGSMGRGGGGGEREGRGEAAESRRGEGRRRRVGSTGDGAREGETEEVASVAPWGEVEAAEHGRGEEEAASTAP
ncbi:hypothetical protein GUJ93_ZPchr0008g11494 [Zizania palustris]|uniref:Uncharacterized protein n=1 Tax=Zizania palustris TaxID=103762 RepID=A0A8J5V597_ZIZPA|nr:hypothetical protein GUJ93_ZPchr0008g11494 [Zizania palustris]